jgi:ATP-binding cassette, subfamily F, member 3
MVRPVLTFSDVRVRRGLRELFTGATFAVRAGEKVGVTGANGSGKSTLLELVRGDLEVDAGTIERRPGLTVASVAQEVSHSDTRAVDFVLDGDAELRATERAIAAASATADGRRLGELHAHLEAIGGYDAQSRAARLLRGLGFAQTDGERPVSEFSGGWRVRLAIAQALMCRSDLLLLDEPTNHLDLDAIWWLEEWLRTYAGTLLVIAHDREFLDRVVGRIVNIERGRVDAYAGNYSAFEAARAQRLAQQAALYERQQREIRHITRFIERFRASASRARQAQSRLKALARLERIAPAHVDSHLRFSIEPPDALPRPLLAIESQCAGYDACGPVVRDVTLTLAPGDRIALLGRNGAGKSTVVKLLAGRLESAVGERIEARALRIGYFAQLELEQLTARESAIEQLRHLGGAEAAAASEQELRDYLGRYGFSGERAFQPVGDFSGGEKARLVLAVICRHRPNLLLLDEPTNHLDLDMRDALALALQDYEGAVVLVSHDRHLLRVTVDRLWLVADGELREFAGDLDDYEHLLRQPGRTPLDSRASETGSESMSRRERRRVEAQARQQVAPLRAEVARLEAEIARLAERIEALDEELSSESLYREESKPRLAGVIAERQRSEAARLEAEAAWLAACERLERAAEAAG